MFGYYFDRRYIYIAIGIIALLTLVGMSSAELFSMLLSLPAIIIAITFHEYAHALTAVKLGDDTPREQGRLSLNPLKHMDPFGFIMLLFLGFGWGKPVETNPSRYNRNVDMTKGQAIVSFAGPAMNFMLAIIFSLIYAITMKYATSAFLVSNLGVVVMSIITSTIFINIGLGVFNLIPLPPLDGSKILKNFMSYNTRRKYEESEQLFYIIFLALWITGLAGTIISPIINFIANGILKLVFQIVL